MTKLKDTSVEWALKHLVNFYDSDFFPRLFEFDAIQHNWQAVKEYLLSLDIDKYAPKNPMLFLALKPNSTFRVVHQLEPIDSLIYTALVYEHSETIEKFRIPENRTIACSYRIKPDIKGSFFERDTNGYDKFLQQSASLAEEYEGGFTLVCDIVDFYNQIYLHRVENALSDAGSEDAKVLADFLSGLNGNISRGIPVGPAPSILIAEAIMADINKKILTETRAFVQYVDDLYIFFEEETEAQLFLHVLTQYLYSNHRLVLSSDKTKILPIGEFEKKYLKEETQVEREAIHLRLEKLSGQYGAPEEIESIEDLESEQQTKVRSSAYLDMFEAALKFDVLESGLIKHILRQAGSYRIRNLIPHIFAHFDKLLPVIREIVIYLNKVLNESGVKYYVADFRSLLSSPFLKLPFVNMWIFTLFQNEHFNAIDLDIDYNDILRIREKALIAKREKNLTFIKEYKAAVDTLGPWDRRAVLYASEILSKDEAGHWLALQANKGDIVNTAICSLVIHKKKKSKKPKKPGSS